MLKTKVLYWKPVPDRQNTVDCYAERNGMRWTVKRASLNHNTFYVLRLNGVVIRRFELWRSARLHAENLALEREVLR